MSETDKGAIVEKLTQLPPIMQATAEGFIAGLAAASKREREEKIEQPRDDKQSDG